MKIGIVGLGYWGPNLVRNFMAQPEVEKIIGCDREIERLKFIKSKFPGVELTDDYDTLLASDVNAIVIATPVDTHYPLALKAIQAGKHVWIEKPFTSSSSQGEHLIEEANKRKLVIFVDHTFIYTGAVMKMKELIESKELGEIIYFDSVRINLGLFQQDVNVMWDLVPHDLSIMRYVLNHKIISGVTANGIANFYNQENIAHLAVHFENQECFAHFHVNWTSPVKMRRMIVAGTKKMLVFDDMENSEKIKVYDSGVDVMTKENVHKALVQYRIGDMYSPKIEQTEALSNAAKEFISSIKENRLPLTNAYDGLEVVQILEAANKSIKSKGILVDVTNPYFELNNTNKTVKQAVGF